MSKSKTYIIISYPFLKKGPEIFMATFSTMYYKIHMAQNHSYKKAFNLNGLTRAKNPQTIKKKNLTLTSSYKIQTCMIFISVDE